MLNARVFAAAWIFFAVQGGAALAQNHAPPGEMERQATARRLFAEGLKEADAQRWDKAAALFDQARALRPSAEITYNLTTALVHQGKLVRAAGLLREIAAPESVASSEVKEAARVRLDQLLPRLASLRIEGESPGPPSRTISVDQQSLGDRLGRPMPVDPGVPHVIEVRAGGRLIKAQQVSLADGEERTVSLGGPRDGLPLAAGGDLSLAAPDAALADAAPARNRTWLWVVAGAVVAGTATALVLANRDSNPPSGNVGTWTLGGK